MMISDITPNNNAIYMPSNSLAIFRDDNNDILFSDWQSLGCDTQSNLNIINNLEKYRVMEQLALYSYDFNEILAEIKNVRKTESLKNGYVNGVRYLGATNTLNRYSLRPFARP